MIARMRGGGHQPGDVVVHTQDQTLFTHNSVIMQYVYTHAHKNWIQPTTKKQLNVVRDELVKKKKLHDMMTELYSER